MRMLRSPSIILFGLWLAACADKSPGRVRNDEAGDTSGGATGARDPRAARPSSKSEPTAESSLEHLADQPDHHLRPDHRRAPTPAASCSPTAASSAASATRSPGLRRPRSAPRSPRARRPLGHQQVRAGPARAWSATPATSRTASTPASTTAPRASSACSPTTRAWAAPASSSARPQSTCPKTGADLRGLQRRLLPICLSSCDPLNQDCPEGQACYNSRRRRSSASRRAPCPARAGPARRACTSTSARRARSAATRPRVAGCGASRAAAPPTARSAGRRARAARGGCASLLRRGHGAPQGYENVGVCAIPE
jgi:hypothetical protein